MTARLGLPLVIVGLGCFTWSTGRGPAADEPAVDSSVVFASATPREKGKNGSAYEKGVIELGAGKKLAVPQGAEIVRTGSGTQVQVFVVKRLHFGGHPPEPMDIAAQRGNFGVATKADGDVLQLATFGEFSTKEGGADVKLRVIVPPGVDVEPRPGLSGAQSAAQSNDETKPKNGYWYGPSKPGTGWTAFATTPDPAQTIEVRK